MLQGREDMLLIKKRLSEKIDDLVYFNAQIED